MKEFNASFLEARKDWLEVRTVDRSDGGWDVVLRIDGVYYLDDPVVRSETMRYFERWLDQELRGS